MDKEKRKLILCDILRWLTVSLSFGYALGACCGTGTVPGVLIAAVMGILFRAETTKCGIFAYFTALALIFFVGKLTSVHLIIRVAIALVISLIAALVPKRIKKLEENPIYSIITILIAFSTTALVTNDYFGIGAEGYTVVEIIKSYVSFGFHPNWRGILYGTIVMVIMITFPRKFKTLFGKIISPAFAALVIIYAMNYFLIPAGTVSPISFVNSQLPGFFFDGRMPISAPAVVLIVGAWQAVDWGKVAYSFKRKSKK